MRGMKALISVLLVSMLILIFACGEKDSEKAGTGEPDYRIGIVFDVGGKGDKSFNDSAYDGLVQIAKEYNGYISGEEEQHNYGDKIELKYLEPREGGQDRETLLRVMAEDGYNLVIGVGFMFSDSIGKVAKDFPDVHFGLIDGFIPELTKDSNITCLSFAEHEGSFLIGAVAGMKVQDEGKLGFIGGMDSPLIHKFHGGYYAGAMYVNERLREEGQLLGQYVASDPSGFQDPQGAANIATNMYNNGAEIIYHAAGGSGNGLFKAAEEQDKLAIGVDSDQGLVYASSDNSEEQKIAEHIFTSMLKRVDRSVFLTAQELINTGSVTGGYKTFGLDEKGVGVGVNKYNKEKVEPYMDTVETLKQKITSGEITVPTSDENIEEWAKNNL